MAAPSHHYDFASALWQGMRPYQEDSIAIDFHAGVARGFAVVADGMGGHAAGDVASNLVAVHASGHLRLAAQDMPNADRARAALPAALGTAIEKANTAIAEHVRQDSGVAGMGATMLAIYLVDDQLYWGSVGDSPLFLVRDGTLQQLNQDHSMAPVIAAMVERGELTPDQGKQHPDRNALTSVLMGERIEKSDVPNTSFALQAGDVLIAASDGLQFLANDRVLALVQNTLPASSAALCDALMNALKELGDPQQDNAAIVVVQPRLNTGDETAAEDNIPAAQGDVEPGAPLQQRPQHSGPQTRIVSEEEAQSVADEASTLIEDLGAEKITGSPSPSVSHSDEPPSSALLVLLLAIGLAVAAGLVFYFRSSAP